MCCFFVASRSRQKGCAVVTGVETCALPIWMGSVPARSRPITASRKKALSQSASMVIIPASLADFVEAVGGVTGIALVDARLRSGWALRDHAEMLHEVTGRRLMALGALRRIDRKSTRLNSSH